MVVFVQSWGSVWQERGAAQGGTRIWNTTGIAVGDRAQPRSRIFGQIAFGRQARFELGSGDPVAPSLWIATSLESNEHARQLFLLTHPPNGTSPDRILVTVTERLVGRLADTSWDRTDTKVVSFSEWRDRQEVMLLMHPYGWIRGSSATAVLLLDAAASSRWTVSA